MGMEFSNKFLGCHRKKKEWDAQGNIKSKKDELGPIIDQLWDKYKQKVNHTKQEIELRSRKKLQRDVKHLKNDIRDIKRMLIEVIKLKAKTD